MKLTDLQPHQLAQDLPAAGRRYDYLSLQNVLMTQSALPFILHSKLTLSLLPGFMLKFTSEFELN